MFSVTETSAKLIGMQLYVEATQCACDQTLSPCIYLSHNDLNGLNRLNVLNVSAPELEL